MNAIDKLKKCGFIDAVEVISQNKLEPILSACPKAQRYIITDIYLNGDDGCRDDRHGVEKALLMALYSNNLQRAITIMYRVESLFRYDRFDCFSMAWNLNKPFNPFWSTSRIDDYHDELQKIQRLKQARAQRVDYDLSYWDNVFPPSITRRLIKNSVRLALEGIRQDHCVADYSSKIEEPRGNHRIRTAIASIIHDGYRWTVELSSNSNRVRMGQIQGPKIGGVITRPTETQQKSIIQRFGVAEGRPYDLNSLTRGVADSFIIDQADLAYAIGGQVGDRYRRNPIQNASSIAQAAMMLEMEPSLRRNLIVGFQNNFPQLFNDPNFRLSPAKAHGFILDMSRELNSRVFRTDEIHRVVFMASEPDFRPQPYNPIDSITIDITNRNRDFLLSNRDGLLALMQRISEQDLNTGPLTLAYRQSQFYNMPFRNRGSLLNSNGDT